jgi:hypothetical protein
MICFIVSSIPLIGDMFSYDGREYQLISNPIPSCMQGGLLTSTVRYTNANVCIEKAFYFEVNS